MIERLTRFLAAWLDRIDHAIAGRADRQAVDDRIAEVRSAVDRAEEACVEAYRVMNSLPPETAAELAAILSAVCAALYQPLRLSEEDAP